VITWEEHKARLAAAPDKVTVQPPVEPATNKMRDARRTCAIGRMFAGFPVYDGNGVRVREGMLNHVSADHVLYDETGWPLLTLRPAEPEPAEPAWKPTPGLAPAGIAAEFLLHTLEHGELRATEVQAKAKQVGIAEKTLRRAAKALGITSFRNTKEWLWKLGS
jgi:hypothetical protein